MLRKRLKNPIFLIYLLVIYVTFQFGWWLYLIFTLYSDIYTEPGKLSKKIWMLVGEGSVFFLILIVGVMVILKAFRRERALTRQQENFVLSVTHELKTPISSVKLFLQTLKKRELSEDKKDEIYDRSLLEINRLDGLVSNILLTRNIENNNYFLDKTKTHLTELIENKVDSLRGSILKDHQVHLELSDLTVEVDVLAFESILVNLLENAAKYSPSGSNITISLLKNHDTIILKVADEGAGIPKEKRDLVFAKFYREENEMTRRSKGTGLGLYITRFLVKQHGGQITLGANDPNGLVVTIQLNDKWEKKLVY